MLCLNALYGHTTRKKSLLKPANIIKLNTYKQVKIRGISTHRRYSIEPNSGV